MRRRDFIAGLGGAVVVGPRGASGQQAAMPLVGFLSSQSQATTTNFLASFRRGLEEMGFTEGRNVRVEYRWAEGKYDQLPALARELLERGVVVLVAAGGPISGRAAKAATATVPIGFMAGDALRDGLASSINQPTDNATGVSVLQSEMESKR